MRIAVIALSMVVMVFFGGAMAMTPCAEDETPAEDVVVEDVVEDDVVEDEVVADVEDVVAEDEDVDEDEGRELTPAEIIAAQTGLHIDYIECIDSCSNWSAWYLHCDGDLYVVTLDEGCVDVCVILN